MSTNLYPPVRAPTLDQELLSSSGTRIHPSQYKTLDFSPLFQSIYGRPTTTYHAWARLWSIPSSRILEAVCPRYPSATTNFLGFAGYRERFVEFCLEVDGCCGGGEGAMMVGRLEMEGAWVKVLLGLFEEMKGQREKMRAFVGMRVGGAEGRLLMTIREVEGEMRDVLRRAVEQRFNKDAEAYWDRKWRIHGFRCPDLDVKRVTDWSVEAPFQKSLLKPEDINDNDYDETDDEHEHEHDHENRNNNQDHDESNDENNDSAVAMEGIEKKQNPTPNSTKAKVQDAMSEGSDAILGANQNTKKNPEAKLPKEEETGGTRETLKQEMRLEESNGIHGSLPFSD